MKLISYASTVVDIPAEIQISGGYIERYPTEDMQFKSRGYDSHFKLFFR